MESISKRQCKKRRLLGFYRQEDGHLIIQIAWKKVAIVYSVQGGENFVNIEKKTVPPKLVWKSNLYQKHPVSIYTVPGVAPEEFLLTHPSECDQAVIKLPDGEDIWYILPDAGDRQTTIRPMLKPNTTREGRKGETESLFN